MTSNSRPPPPPTIGSPKDLHTFAICLEGSGTPDSAPPLFNCEPAPALRDTDWPANPFEVVKVPEGLATKSRQLASVGGLFGVFFRPESRGWLLWKGRDAYSS
jgi:hypothetical protein